MKRYPKRARPLWGKRRKLTGPPIRWTGLTFTFPEGTYVNGGGDEFTSMPIDITWDGRVHHVGSIGARGVIVISADSPGGPFEEFNRAIKTVNERRGELGFPGIAEPLGESTIDALSRAISEGLQSKLEREVTVTATVTGDMIHASAEYVPSHIERVQFFEALREMTIDPGTVLVLPSCGIKVET